MCVEHFHEHRATLMSWYGRHPRRKLKVAGLPLAVCKRCRYLAKCFARHELGRDKTSCDRCGLTWDQAYVALGCPPSGDTIPLPDIPMVEANAPAWFEREWNRITSD